MCLNCQVRLIINQLFLPVREEISQVDMFGCAVLSMSRDVGDEDVASRDEV